MSKYQIYKVSNRMNKARLLKEYPLKSQAYMWCWLHGYVICMGRYGYALDGRLKIVEVKNEEV